MSAGTGPARAVVVGVDGSEPAGRALHWAGAAAVTFGARLVAVHAVGLLEGAGYTGGFDLDAALADLAGAAGSGGVEASAVYEPGPPDLALQRVADREGADLIVVGHRGAGETLEPLGSTAAAVVAATRVPVVVVP